ncbi:hypothetical protein C8R46DRAFT_1213596 [Mycena filopes]|nr:hypothetical protein C8R46DRAFT_1213596 [Mycena filopes]
MHASLRLETISNLPLMVRALAKRAANGSLEDLRRLSRLIPTNPSDKYQPYLAVFFVNLDPSRIPDDDLATDAVACAFVALNGVLALGAMSTHHVVGSMSTQVSTHCGYDLWPRIWKWIINP